jgi:hypothetical protein
MSLDVQAEIAAIKKAYDAAATTKYFRAIIFGDIGTGKTYLQRTCPRPVHVDSFDPGGTKTNRRMIEEGWMIADTSFENEEPTKPTVLKLYQDSFNRRGAGGYFEAIGTYFLDGITMFSKAAMNFTVVKKMRVDGIPKVEQKGGDNDYVSQMALIEPAIRSILNLPCHVIITAHPDLSTDEDVARKIIGPQVTGQLKMRLPLMVDEIYCAQTEPKADGSLKYRLLTRQNGIYRCRSRLASEGKIEMYEDQDIKAILRKAGYSAEDKPMPWLKK